MAGGVLDVAVDAYQRAGGAHGELARVQGEAARLEERRGTLGRAADLKRAAMVAANEATLDDVNARHVARERDEFAGPA